MVGRDAAPSLPAVPYSTRRGLGRVNTTVWTRPMNSEWVQHQAPAELALSGIETPFQPARVFDVALHTPHERLVSSLRSDNMADAVQFVWCSVTSWMCMVSLPVHDPATGKVGRGALSEFSLDSCQSPICFVAMKRVAFQDRHVWLSSCNNPGCQAHRFQHPRVALVGFDRDDPWDLSEQNFTALFDNEEGCMCACGKAVQEHLCRAACADHERRPPSFDAVFVEAQNVAPAVLDVVIEQRHCKVVCGDARTPEPAVEDMGVLRAHGNAWLCFSCLRNKQKCPHVRVAEGAEGVAEQAATQLKNDVDHFLDPTTGKRRLTCLSSTKIPTMSESSSHPAMRDFLAGNGFPDRCTLDLSLPCHHCGSLCWGVLSSRKCFVFMAQCFREVHLDKLICHNCSSTREVDGAEYAFLIKAGWAPRAFGVDRADGKALVAFHWSLLLASLQRLCKAHNSWRDEWEAVVRNCTSFHDLNSAQQAALWALYVQFQEATMDAQQLTGVDIHGSCSCVCEPEERFKNLTADGMAVSIPRSNMRLVGVHLPRLEEDVAVCGSSHYSRVLIPHKDTRALLELYTGTCQAPQQRGLHEATFQQILDEVARKRDKSPGCPELASFIQVVTHVVQVPIADGGLATYMQCPAWAAPFIRRLASSAPVAAMIKPAQAELVQAFIESPSLQTAEALASVQCIASACRRVVVSADCEPAVQDALVKLLTRMQQVQAACYERQAPRRGALHTGTNKDAYTNYRLVNAQEAQSATSWTAQEALFRTGFSPGPEPYAANEYGGALRPMRLYAQDFVGRKCADEGKCSQVHASRKKLGPGLMLFTCVGCQRVVHFSMMADAESPQTFFSICRTRLPRDIEKNVSYDNACNAFDYIANREPEDLAKLNLYIDALHRKGHTNCLDDFGTDLHRSKGLPLFKDSAAAERRNLLYKPLQTAAAHMKQTTFLWRVSLITHHGNTVLAKELRDKARHRRRR